MKKPIILPADSYTVINKTIVELSDRKLITMLYQPIIGHVATSLYFTLIDDLDKKETMSDDLTHYHLMATMKLRLEEVIIAREKLEAVGLLRTYLKKDNINHYAYLIYSPLSASDFLNHPILNIVLYNNIGKNEYDKIVEYYKVPRINLKDYEEITSSFSETFSQIDGKEYIENTDIRENQTNHINVKEIVDFNMLITGFNNINERCFNQETKDLINNLAFIYKIDNLTMQGLVRNCINERGLIDKTELRKSCRNFYQFENDGKLPSLVYRTQPDYLKTPSGDTSNRAKMIYTFENTSPIDYLRSKYKTGEPAKRDIQLIESLIGDTKLSPGVVNVLISYVLQINNQKLSKNYIDTIAGQWKRLNIETVPDAMAICEKEHKKVKKKLESQNSKPSNYHKKQEQLPEWFNKNLENKEVSKDDQAEMDRLLKELS